LYLGDKVILIGTSDHSLTSWAGHRECHTVSLLAMCAVPSVAVRTDHTGEVQHNDYDNYKHHRSGNEQSTTAGCA
jgi:hypothetical protein